MNQVCKGRWLAVILCSFVLVTAGGCAKKAKTVEKMIEAPRERVATPGEAFPQEASVIQERELESARAVVRLGDIFYDFDRDLIRPDGRRVLEGNARWLKQNGDRRIVIEGHADERGTTEYNLALAERRAQAAKRYLVSLGIEPGRIRTISYGEERPFCLEHNEQCWQENRRGHFALAD
jgi:peptidoglycan-associated lipoprotein